MQSHDLVKNLKATRQEVASWAGGTFFSLQVKVHPCLRRDWQWQIPMKAISEQLDP